MISQYLFFSALKIAFVLFLEYNRACLFHGCSNMKTLMKSFKYAHKGILKAYRYERNLKIMVAISLASFVLSYVFSLSTHDFLLILLCNGIAHAVELLNTSVEYLCDHVCEGYHKDIETVKDIAAAATLLVVVVCAAVALIIFAQAL